VGYSAGSPSGGKNYPRGMLLLVPADPLRPHRVDAHFAEEAAAARDVGVVVAVVDHDVLSRGGEVDRAVAKVPAGEDAVYRGWMLRSEHYAGFVGARVAGVVG
jgi:CubicO group peptidase (beta-lactamase class C family)